MINLSNTTFSYMGDIKDAPENPTLGDLRIDSRSNEILVYTGSGWEFLTPIINKGNIIEDLEEIVSKYPTSEIAKDIKVLLEIYRMGIYE